MLRPPERLFASFEKCPDVIVMQKNYFAVHLSSLCNADGDISSFIPTFCQNKPKDIILIETMGREIWVFL